MDDPYNKIQLQTELGIFFYKKVFIHALRRVVKFFRVLRNILRDFVGISYACRQEIPQARTSEF